MTNQTTFPVYYPHGGKMLLMEWWTHNEGSHVILARSEQTMQQTASRVFEEHPTAEIRSYLEVEVVAPSKLLCDLLPKYDYQENVDSFKIETGWRLKQAIKAGHPLPTQFKKCQAFESIDDTDEDAESSKWKKENHYDCKNCNEGITYSLTDEELYEQYGKRWNETDPDTVRRDKNRVRDDHRVSSRADQARDDESLWCAVARFGHHSTGIAFVEVEQTIINDFSSRPDYLSNQILFFYRKLSELDQAKFSEPLEAAKQKAAAKREQSAATWANERSRQNEERINTFLSFFNESK